VIIDRSLVASENSYPILQISFKIHITMWAKNSAVTVLPFNLDAFLHLQLLQTYTV
jgi:hypothetical protein